MSSETQIKEEVLYKDAREQRIVFFLVFMGIVSLTYGLLFIVDFLPEKPGTKSAPVAEVIAPAPIENIETAPPVTAVEVDPYPVAIIFDSLNGREVPILNPESRSISALDTALLSGAVRHPDSADFERTGTIFLLGHSSYLPHVINKNFQAFNGIQNLVWGDVIRLRSSDTEYVYRVDRMYKAMADDAEIKIQAGTPKLTLATCDSFGTKDDRFVVEATLVETHAIDS